MKTTDYINYEADAGKVFVRKADGLVMGWGLGLGSADRIDNYDEADCPEEYKGVEGYDNTLREANEKQDINIIDFPSSRVVS